MMKRVWLTVAMAGLLVTLGCGDEEQPGPGEQLPKANEPKDALRNMQTAVKNADKDQFVSCFDATDDQAAVLDVMADFMFTAMAFEEKMKAEYGEDAVKQPEGQDNDLKAAMKDDWLEGVTIDVQGDTATATHPDDDQTVELVKVDGQWKLAGKMLGGTTPEGAEAEMALKMFTTLTKAYKDMMGKIGAEGYTAEKINEEIGMAMMQAMMGGMMPKDFDGGNGPEQPAP
ncbi:MAG: hypothetical protein KGY99_03645 [Phycisphaerae bacterium]|nr:hypothetical protein [Phycisphaerae bacterium]